MKKIAVLLTCFNRKSKTLACLEALYANELPKDYTFEVFLVDDGSTDGTSSAVAKAFPEVEIIQGTGSLYWNQGMRLAWQTAAEKYDYDFYFWLNDDTFLTVNALQTMLDDYNGLKYTSESDVIITAACCESKSDQRFSYGGRDAKEQPVTPYAQSLVCRYINGNAVLVPKKVCQEIGLLSEKYTHAIGDFDYGLRAIEAGFQCYTTSSYVAYCESHSVQPIWSDAQYSLQKRWQHFNSPVGLHIKEYTYFRKRHFKDWQIYILKAYLKMLVPSLYLKILKK